MTLRNDFYPTGVDIDVARKIEQKLKKLKRRDYITKIVKEGVIRIVGG